MRLFASLGLGGFAFKDALSNIIAGILIFVYKPFCVGFYIKVIGLERKAVSIDLRYTIIERNSKKVLIPNATLLNNPVELISS